MIAIVTLQDQVHAYIDRVLDGRQVASRYVVGACRRHRADLARMTDPDFPYEFSPSLAMRAVNFFPMILRHTTGEWAGHPFELSDWQTFCIWSIFGWVESQPAAVTTKPARRFRRAYITVGRKNGKTQLAAGIALLVFHLDGEAGAQVFCAATKREQATILFGEADKMTRASTDLSKITLCRVGNLSVASTGSFMRPTSSDRPYDGLNPHGVFLDELHAWTDVHRRFYDTITTGSASRRQPLFLTITTAGDDKSHIWREENDHAERVASGELIDERLFSFVARIDDEDDAFDETCWEKANPNLGISVKLDYLRQQAQEARNKPTYRNAFIRYHCNRRVSSVEHAITSDQWLACKRELSDWKKADYISAGFDLGGRDDLAAIGLCARFPMQTDDEGRTVWRYELRARSYLATRSKRDLVAQPWNRWIWEQRLVKVDAVVLQVKTDLLALAEAFGVCSVAYDPHNAKQLGEELEAGGITAAAMTQSYSQYNEPLREFLNAVHDGRISHDGDEVLAWCISNLAIATNQRGEWMPDKASSKDKIDAAVACIMAFRECYFAAGGQTWYYATNPMEAG